MMRDFYVRDFEVNGLTDFKPVDIIEQERCDKI
jgi:hypothetical protein